jgi:hypothetical protein
MERCGDWTPQESTSIPDMAETHFCTRLGETGAPMVLVWPACAKKQALTKESCFVFRYSGHFY